MKDFVAFYVEHAMKTTITFIALLMLLPSAAIGQSDEPAEQPEVLMAKVKILEKTNKEQAARITALQREVDRLKELLAQNGITIPTPSPAVVSKPPSPAPNAVVQPKTIEEAEKQLTLAYKTVATKLKANADYVKASQNVIRLDKVLGSSTGKSSPPVDRAKLEAERAKSQNEMASIVDSMVAQANIPELRAAVVALAPEVTAKQVEVLGEKYEGKTVKISQCKFLESNVNLVSELPGVTLESNGLQSVLDAREHQKWIGFALHDSAGTFFQFAFASKVDYGEVLAAMKKNTQLNLVGRVVRMSGTLAYGLVCSDIEIVQEQKQP